MCRLLQCLFIETSSLIVITISVMGRSPWIVDAEPLESHLGGERTQVLHPHIGEAGGWRRRLAYPNVYSEESTKLTAIKVGDWDVELNSESDSIVGPKLVAEWVSPNNWTSTPRAPPECEYKSGVVRGRGESSRAALVICGGGEVTGYLDLGGGEIVFVEPAKRLDGAHILHRMRRSLDENAIRSEKQGSPQRQWFSNLTGDTFDIDADQIKSRKFHIQEDEADVTFREMEVNETTSKVQTQRKWFREQLLDNEEIGYFYDTAWSADPSNSPTGHKRVVSHLPPRWLEIAIGVDYTLIDFHGKDKVEGYVLALMNIVNAIYRDVSLEANLKLVVTRLLLYEHKSQSVVRPGNARKSLENVNAWNKKLHAAMAPGEPHHDIAVWLTRTDIGGPSGYAPVAGACDPKRSCALNRDEGLTSAFIIAHEMAHILGLSHDGDTKASNKCDKADSSGSVMASLVAATFHKFSWSDCSRAEFRRNAKKWSCLSNPPAGLGEIVLNATLQTAFSMDEQCRMEFGDGYALCRAFDIIEPCSHLWCGHEKSPLVCKTKRGSPLERTECGFNKWCIEGYCQTIHENHLGRIPITLNPQDGGWSSWDAWRPCSRSCGRGVQFRTRTCNNPSPMHGGTDCTGLTEEWQICNKNKPCPEPLADLRAEQCKRLPKILDLKGTVHDNQTWLPYESDEKMKKCKLICISEQTKETFASDENLIDGTHCSYDDLDNICIQGVCQSVGCDGQMNSKVKTDMCGVCGGNNSNCSDIEVLSQRRLKREVSRIAVLPRLATFIKIDANLTMSNKTDPAVAFILKNRRKKKYTITIPNTGLRSDIMEGTKFLYEKRDNKHSIWAKGPVLAEMVVLIYAPKSEIEEGLSVSLFSKYIINKGATTAGTRYKWILGGWGPCSVSCGGGKRQKTIACWDTLNRKLVRRKHCSLMTKPALTFEKCNTFECNFQWVSGKWEPSSATCGLDGVQERELYCVPQEILTKILFKNNGTVMDGLWKYMVSPNKCSGVTPQSRRSCNKEACPSYWTYGEWSQCSTTCGKGTSYRTFQCSPPPGENFYTCGEMPQKQKQSCHDHSQWSKTFCRGHRITSCQGDKSEHCSLPYFKKYCKLGEFRKLCCKSCLGLHTENT